MRGQEEVAGFVVIVVIVLVISVIVLGVMVRQRPEPLTNSQDIYNFLEASLSYTTSCATSFEPAYLTLGELFEKCRSGSICISGKSACSVANETLRGIVGASWNISSGSSVRGYRFVARYKTNTSDSVIVSLSQGNCTGNFKESEYPYPYPIKSSFRLCS
ncbi:hypothetical protein KW805_04585 [Candidatus Pacearchaeota archaeon]|nr:hypothetical protein [Candidatus Pacearchaeota archaeon]